MKKIFITLLLFCFYVAQGAHGAMIIQQFSSSQSYFYYGDWEDSGARDEWATDVGSDEDYSSSGLDMGGSYVARINASAGVSYHDFGRDIDEATVILRIRMETLLAGTERMIDINTTGDAFLCGFYIKTDGAFYVYLGAIDTGPDVGFTDDTTYWVKLRYKKGTGANAECEGRVWLGSAWSTAAEITDSDSTAQVGSVRIKNTLDTPDTDYVYYDDIYIFEGDFTGDPDTL